MNILTDYHHDSLLNSLYMLFEGRLGHKLYRQTGMEWYYNGYWAINDQEATARQFLAQAVPEDGTRQLTNEGHRVITYAEFLEQDFDLIIASIPAHIEPFKRLAAMKGAKFCIQIGNEWPLELFEGENVLASIKPRRFTDTNIVFYHQEFDLDIFHPAPVPSDRKVYSFINCMQQQMPNAWMDFTSLEMLLANGSGFEFRSFGGQCRDGNMNGPQELADKMREASMIFHVKEGGDGFGHILYNAYAVGRPIITRRRYYRERLGEELMVPGTCIDLDEHNYADAFHLIKELFNNPQRLEEMGESAAAMFHEVVDYEREADDIRAWLAAL